MELCEREICGWPLAKRPILSRPSINHVRSTFGKFLSLFGRIDRSKPRVNLLVIIILATLPASAARIEEKNKVLSVGCFIPGYSEGDYFGYATAIEMARDWINENGIIPDNYTLELDCGDTSGMAAYAIGHLGSLLNSEPKKVAFLGPAFTKALLPIAEALQLFSVPQVSFASTYAYFNNLLQFPYLFRTVPSTQIFNRAKVKLLETYNWRKVGMIYDRDDAPLSLASSLLHKRLIRMGYTVVGPFGVSRWDNDMKPVLQKFKEQNVKIFIGDFLSVIARRVFCSAYKLGIYGAKYMWIIHGNIRNRLIKKDDFLECTPVEVKIASNLVITAGQLNYIVKNETTITGETTYELSERLIRTAKKNDRQYRTYSPYAFDAVISLGLVIRDTFETVNWKEMDYLNHTAGAIFKAAFRNLSFQGLTGLVRFTQRSQRVVNVALQQVINGVETLVGTYDNTTDNVTFLNMRRSFEWHSQLPPLDKEKVVKIPYKMAHGLSLAMVTIGGIGIFISSILLLTMKRHWRSEEIKKSSPMMNVVITVGCVLSYSTVCLLGTESFLDTHHSIALICKAKLWISSVGFSCTYGSMFAKNWRVFRIMTNKLLRKDLSLISNKHLFGMVGTLLALDTAYMIVWDIVHSVKVEVVWEPSQVYPDKDLIVQKYSYACNCNIYSWWVIGLLFYKAVLLAFGLFLAFETRHAYKEVNESRNIAFTIYNVTVFSIISTVTALAQRKHPNQELSGGIIGSSITICTTITLTLISFPSIAALIRRRMAGRKEQKTKDLRILSADMM